MSEWERHARLDQARKDVEQLKREVSIQRIKVSMALTEMRNYIMEQQETDPLIQGFAFRGNPYRERTSRCEVL